MSKDSDILALLPLLEELGYPSNFEELKIRYNNFLKNPEYGIAVYEMNREIIGFIAWSMSHLIVSDAKRIHIEGIAVSSEYRNLGIGKKLIQFIEDIAKKSSPCIVDLTSGMRRKDDGTHEFYYNLGYKNEGHMAKLYLKKVF